MSPGGTTNNERRTREDRATQPLGCWKAEFRNFSLKKVHVDLGKIFLKNISLSGKYVRISAPINNLHPCPPGTEITTERECREDANTRQHYNPFHNNIWRGGLR